MTRLIQGRRHRPGLEVLETRQVLSSMVGLTTDDALVAFESHRPDVVLSTTPIVGLRLSETILAIDSRAATGQLYALGSTGRIYTLDPSSGTASLVGNGPIAIPLSGNIFNIDFNGGSGTLRISSDLGQDLRVDVDSDVLSVDPNLNYAPTDAGAGTPPHIVAAAYNNNNPDSTSRTLFEIDAARSALVTQQITFNASGVEQSSGQLQTSSLLGMDVGGATGLEITPDGSILLSTTPTGSTRTSLYQFNGGGNTPFRLVGAFPAAITVRDIATMPSPKTVFAVTASNALISFASATPGTLLSSHAILGLQPGEWITSIAFRPKTGVLYGFGTSGRLYTINTTTGGATAVSSLPISPAYDGSKPSIDFFANSDRVRLVTKSGQNLRINPDLGVVDEVDTPLTYAAGDPASGFAPSIVTESQATISDAGSSSIPNLFGIDSARDTLVLQHSPSLTDKLTTIGPLGIDITDAAGLDNAPFTSGTTITLASLTETGATASTLYRINPRASASSDDVPLIAIGTIGGGSIVRDIAIAPTGIFGFASDQLTAQESSGVATVTVTRTAGSSGPVQVRYLSFNGTAQAGVDYTPVNGVLNFANGETSKTFTIALNANSFAAGSRTINLSLSLDPGVSGSFVNASLSIVAPIPTDTPGLASSAFFGSATAITSVDFTFKGPVNPIQANDIHYYLVRGITSGRSAKTIDLALASVVYDPATFTAHVTLAKPIALRDFRTLQAIGQQFGEDRSNTILTYGVQKGVGVHYLDGDGDRVLLGVIGRGAKLVVLRRADGGAASAWVEGNGKVVTGILLARRGSNHTTVIDRFVTNGAKLRLAKSITVRSIAVTG